MRDFIKKPLILKKLTILIINYKSFSNLVSNFLRMVESMYMMVLCQVKKGFLIFNPRFYNNFYPKM